MEIILGVVMFTLIVLVLSGLILAARAKLVNSGDDRLISMTIRRIRSVPRQGLNALRRFVSSAAQRRQWLWPVPCGSNPKKGGGDILPTELSHITGIEAKRGMPSGVPGRFMRQNMKVELPEEIAAA